MSQFKWLIISFLCFFTFCVNAQISVRGKVVDAATGEPMYDATVVVKGTTEGAKTDFEGDYTLKLNRTVPLTLTVSYVGYAAKDVEVTAAGQQAVISMSEDTKVIGEFEVLGQRVDDQQKKSALTVEQLDGLAIKATASTNFYNGLGALKGVDLTTASLGFTVINMRGFNSTSPVRSLQIIDGVDNQAPGLNFSLGNFLGSSELDVAKVDIVQGASSSFYGPNAFNGVISMETKNPFYTPGLGVMLKGGERNLLEAGLRWADVFNNKAGHPFFAYKFNFSALQANDWVADNYNPVDGATHGTSNAGGYDKVNVYGDEASSLFKGNAAIPGSDAGLGTFYRTGYREEDIVDYNTKNLKLGAALHFRLQPQKEMESPTLILASNYGNGTTVYQGDNRFSLRGINFLQNRVELRKSDKYFVRAYMTTEDAGRSYDPYFTALRMQESVKEDIVWGQDYRRFWRNSNFDNKMVENGYPISQIVIDPVTGLITSTFDVLGANNWITNNSDSLQSWHQQASDYANTYEYPDNNPYGKAYLEPGTERFQQAFDSITSRLSSEGGTRFYDKSDLYHLHGQYRFTPAWCSYILVGGNGRLYTPDSRGTIFVDTNGRKIQNIEFGAYAGIEKKLLNDKLIATATLRTDKNQNFKQLFTPSASLVYAPNKKDYLRFSFSSAIRNPTLGDQYLNFDVGRATLLGNLNGFQNLITTESFLDFLAAPNPTIGLLDSFNVDPIRPEKVRTFEVGYRTTLFEKVYMDAGFFYSIYTDFIGYNIGVFADVDPNTAFIYDAQVYRVAANSKNTVNTSGFNIGLNYYFSKYYMLAGNYSWNRLLKSVADDPIIPAFNTPEHKFNLSFSARDLPMNLGFVKLKQTGFNINYKWIEGFLFEGSPQFTGFIPTYDLLDVQWNNRFEKLRTTLKIGASNVLNNKQFQTYGGPRIGRMAYVSLLYEWQKK